MRSSVFANQTGGGRRPWGAWGLSLLLMLAGGLQSVALAWPLADDMKGDAHGMLQLIALTVLAAAVDRSASRQEVFRRTWWFSVAWLSGNTWWLYISMHTYGGMSPVLAAAAVALLAAALALLYAAAMWLYRRCVGTQTQVLLRVSAFASAWTLAELARGYVGTGFPWGAIGYAHVDSALRHWAPWVGVYGVGAIAAGLAMALAAQRHDVRVGTGKHDAALVALLALLGGLWFFSPSRNAESLHEGPELSVTLLQGNVAQDLKFGAAANSAVKDYHEALLRSQADLTVTPETAIPFLPEQLPVDYWRDLRGVTQRALLIGLPMRADDGSLQSGRYTNSVLGLVPGQASDYRYDKHHLVPFGEFVPPLFQWFVRQMSIPLGDFSRGALPQPPLHWKGQRIAPNICYEDLFGEELATQFVQTREPPTLLLNLSNIAWFGDTVAIDQHLHISRMRALELGRPMLRATNTGATAVIDAQGQVVQRLPYHQAGALTAVVRGIDGPPTPYARWAGRFGLWPMAGLAALILLVAAWMNHRARHGERRFSRA